MKKYIVITSSDFVENGYKFEHDLKFEGGNAPYTKNVWHAILDEDDYKNYCKILGECGIDYWETDQLEECS